jgi:hypothetical protein
LSCQKDNAGWFGGHLWLSQNFYLMQNGLTFCWAIKFLKTNDLTLKLALDLHIYLIHVCTKSKLQQRKLLFLFNILYAMEFSYLTLLITIVVTITGVVITTINQQPQGSLCKLGYEELT